MKHEGQSSADTRAAAREATRVVVKVGSAVLSKGDVTLHQPTLERICRELVELRKEGRQVVLVSSGAILAGMGRLGLTERPGSIPLKQAAAAVGQSLLMRYYEEAFASYGQKLGQLLLTQEDFRSRHRYLNARMWQAGGKHRRDGVPGHAGPRRDCTAGAGGEGEPGVGGDRQR